MLVRKPCQRSRIAESRNFVPRLIRNQQDRANSTGARKDCPPEATKATTAKAANPLSKINSFFKKIESNFQETRRKQEDTAVAAKKISPELRRKASEFFERDVNEAQRKVLLSESFKNSYYHDAKQVATQGAKLWEAGSKLSAKALSPRIPAFEGTTMDRKPFALHRLLALNKVVLVGVFFNQFGEAHVESFMKPFVEKYSGAATTGKVGIIEINVNEQPIKSPVLKMVSPYIRWTLSEERRKRYMILHENIQMKSKAMRMTNTVLGWVHLVDADGFIRWQAHGLASEKEIGSLFNLTSQLLK